MLEVAGLHADAGHEAGEFAILVRSDLKGHRLGWTLMQLIIDAIRATAVPIAPGDVRTGWLPQ